MRAVRRGCRRRRHWQTLDDIPVLNVAGIVRITSLEQGRFQHRQIPLDPERRPGIEVAPRCRSAQPAAKLDVATRTGLSPCLNRDESGRLRGFLRLTYPGAALFAAQP